MNGNKRNDATYPYDQHRVGNWGDFMKLLSGWKEVAEYLHRTVRTAQRWETAGLPVRRAYRSQRSPVMASSDELERWIHSRPIRAKKDGAEVQLVCKSNYVELKSEHRKTYRKTRRLLGQVGHLGLEQERLLRLIQLNLTSPVSSPDGPHAT